MKSKIDEVVQSLAESEGLTTIEIFEKYPDLKRLKHEEELQEKKKVVNEDKRLLKG